MAPRSPQYSTKFSQPGVSGQLADLQKYGRSMTPVQWFGRTTNATATELALDNLNYSLPASTTPSTALLGRLLIPADSIVTVVMYGAAFDVTQDDNAAGAGNAGFSATFSAITSRAPLPLYLSLYRLSHSALPLVLVHLLSLSVRVLVALLQTALSCSQQRASRRRSLTGTSALICASLRLTALLLVPSVFNT